MSMTSYQEVASIAPLILDAVQSRRMPPWMPDPAYREFVHQRVMSDADIQTLADWVAAGAPEGNPNLTPALPAFPTGAQLGTGDETLQIPTYTIPGNGGDIYQHFVFPMNYATDKFLRAAEVIPANREAVHHVLLYIDTSGKAVQMDAATPEIGYLGDGAGPGFMPAGQPGMWVPGSDSKFLPDGMAYRLPRNSALVVQIHYGPGTNGLKDSTQVRFHFSPEPSPRIVQTVPVINWFQSLLNGPLRIPANQAKTFHARFNLPFDASLLAIAPHMHYIGKWVKCYALPPGGGDTIPLIDIPNWDFHWQSFYYYPKLQKIPAGSVVEAFVHYDNTANNPNNPSNPPKLVTAGESTTQEMLLIYFTFTPYLAGDENISQDVPLPTDTIPTDTIPQSFHASQHPSGATWRVARNASAAPTLLLTLPQAGQLRMEQWDLQGRLLTNTEAQSLAAGTHRLPLETNIAPGTYLLRLYLDGQPLGSQLILLNW
jgi:hypothetical protein